MQLNHIARGFIKNKTKMWIFYKPCNSTIKSIFFCIQFVFKTVVLIIQNWNFDKKKITIFSYSTDHKFSYAILNIFRFMDFWESSFFHLVLRICILLNDRVLKREIKKKNFNIYLQKNKHFNKTSDSLCVYLNIPNRVCPPWATCCYLGTL